MKGLLATIVGLACGAAAAAEPTLRERGAALLEALPEEQREDARWPFDDAERRQVRFAPFLLDGVPHGELDAQASSLAESLLATALSARGHRTVRSVRDLEVVVRDLDPGIASFLLPGFRDPGRYRLAVFGEPRSDGAWAFRYEGHHLSLHVTDVEGRPLATTPLFLGAQPRVVPAGLPSAGVSVLGEEEALARAVHAALPPPLRTRATLDYDGGRDWMLGQVSRVDGRPPPLGVARGDMPPEARDLLDALIERFVGLWSEPAARARREEIETAGRDALHFAFTSADDPPNAFYVRIQGPRLLIEIDNTTDGDHLHAVWHDLEGDFGDDPLARHLRRDHAPPAARLPGAEFNRVLDRRPRTSIRH